MLTSYTFVHTRFDKRKRLGGTPRSPTFENLNIGRLFVSPHSGFNIKLNDDREVYEVDKARESRSYKSEVDGG